MTDTETVLVSNLANGTHTIKLNNLPNPLSIYGYCAYRVTESSADYVYHQIWL